MVANRQIYVKIIVGLLLRLKGSATIADIMRVMPYFLIITVLILGGCSTSQIAARMALPLVEGQYAAIQEEMDPHLAERAMPASLKMMEGLLKEDGKNRVLLNTLAEGFCGYAFSFLEDTTPDRAADLYMRGKNYAVRAIFEETRIEDFDQLAPEPFKAALEKMNEGNVPALFWLGQCWGGWLMLSLDIPKAFADVSKVQWMMERVIELDESYHYGGPHMFLGAFYGSRSKLLGGDPEKSRRHFEESLKFSGDRFLVNRLMYAKTYAVQIQDRKLYEDLLQAVLETPADILPEKRLANEVAKVKAKRLLELTDDIF